MAIAAGTASGGWGAAAAVGLVPAVVAPAVVIPAVASSTQFDITGFIQSATVDTPSDPHSGGTLTVDGHRVVIPRETVVILPANALTWQEMFSHAPWPWGISTTKPGDPTTTNNANPQTGLAMNDSPRPLGTYEVHVVGNRVINGSGDRYIAGLVNISQQELNSGAGYINYINYTTGELEVGGTPGRSGTGTRVAPNDPANPTAKDENGVAGSGRYGRASSPDDRFQVDQDNPTILAETGFPMCIPRVTADPNGLDVNGNPNADDPQCPRYNRPIYTGNDTSGVTPQPALPVSGAFYTVFRMDTPASVDAKNCVRGTCTDPRKQAPLEIGDYVTFAGTLESGGGGQYISAHTITASLGIYTAPGVDPAYVSVDVSLIGTGGLTVFGAGEAAVRTRFEGMTTDETRLIRLYGVDINPITGVTSDREWGTILPDAGPPTGAVRGRWRFRPPCTATVATTKACTPPPAGQFIPPTREVRAVVDGLSQYNPGTIIPNPNSQVPGSVVPQGTPGPQTAANGIFYGQYHAPIGEYIFPENVPGTPIPENNFNTINFLAFGGYQSITGVQAGVLSPWPSNIAPPPFACATATINGGPFQVANGGTVRLSGSVSAGASTPVTMQWSVTSPPTTQFPNGTSVNGALTGATTSSPTFNAAGLAAGTYNVTFTASNLCGASTVATTIVIGAAPPPTVTTQDQTVTAGNLVTVSASTTSTLLPTWSWTQTAGPVAPLPAPAFTQAPTAVTPSATSAIKFTPTVPGTYTYTVTATNGQGTSSPVTVNVVVTPAVPTNITLNNVYRTVKQRLVITATSTDTTVSSMVLQPYLTEAGTMFDPATLGAANLTVSLITPGSFTVTAVGAPSPACNRAYCCPS